MSDAPPTLPSKAELLTRARALIGAPDLGAMGHSEYDAAWVARVFDPATRKPAFPEVLEVVRKSQASDGGWAPEVPFISARILATLSSVLAVTEFDQSPEACQQAKRGVDFVRKGWPRLHEDPDLTIGFELVAASLIKDVQELGGKLLELNGPQGTLGLTREELLGFKLEKEYAEAEALRQDKLSKLALLAKVVEQVRRIGLDKLVKLLGMQKRIKLDVLSILSMLARMLGMATQTRQTLEKSRKRLFELTGLARLSGLSIWDGVINQFARIQSNKERPRKSTEPVHVPDELLYSPELSLGFSFEFLHNELKPQKALGLLVPKSGLIGANVAATCHYIRRSGDLEVFKSLKALVDREGATHIPFGTGTRLWASIWVVYHLRLANLHEALSQDIEPLLELIAENIGPCGVAWSSDITTYGDSDDTGLAFALLHDHGKKVDWTPLTTYERADGFVTLLAERGASVSANAHVLMAIHGRPYPGGRPSEDKAGQLLLNKRIRVDAEGRIGYWTDKWHASPYYGTSRATRALLRWRRAEALPSIRWLLSQQNPKDHGWGYFGRSSAEETAYTIHALYEALDMGLAQDVENRDERETLIRDITLAITRGATYLAFYDGTRDRDADKHHPKLWIAKSLYRPLYVVRTAILAAQVMCSEVIEARPATDKAAA